jgi:integrase/recombinase XerD
VRLFDGQGRRFYFTDDERKAFLAAARIAPREVRCFCGVLHYTGCRISEALALTPKAIDLSSRFIVFESLKKRRRGIYRPVPVPPELLDVLDMVYGIREIQKKGGARLNAKLWSWSRMTAYRRVQEIIEAAGTGKGPHACPKGLRRRSRWQRDHPQNGAEMAGACAADHHRDLCERSRRGRAEHCRKDVDLRRRAIANLMCLLPE